MAVTIRKRPPLRPPTQKNDIYIARKSTFGSLLKRGEHLLHSKGDHINIYALGPLINTAIRLALELKERNVDITWDIQTNTATLIDDIFPENEEDDLSTQKRLKSSIHIKLTHG